MARTSSGRGSTDDRQGARPDSIQAHYDREFQGITSPENYGRTAGGRDLKEELASRALGKIDRQLSGDKPDKSASPDEINDAEQNAAGDESRPLYKRLADHEYKRLKKYVGDDERAAERKHPVKGFFRKQKKALMVTLIINLIVGLVIIAVILLTPLKHIHFERILRAVNYARYHLLVRKQFSRVVFEASVLTRESVGTFDKSPLVKQILLSTPDRQVKQLGRDGRIKWEFRPNGSFGKTVLPLSESLKAVVIDNNQRVDIDEISKDLFSGKNYDQLTRRQRWTVQSRFVSEVNFKLGDLMALQPRTVRWNPYKNLRLRADIRLIKWFNGAREYLGETPDQARAKSVDQDVERLLGDPDARPRSASKDINEDADEARAELIDARRENRTPAEGLAPGDVRSRLASRIQAVGAISDGVFVTTMFCIVRDLANYAVAGQAAKEIRAAKFAADMMTTTDQQATGDTVGEAVGAANGMWDTDGRVPDAVEHPLYAAAIGEARPLTKEDSEQMLKVPPLSQGELMQEISERALNYFDGGIIGILTGKVSGTQKLVSEKLCTALLDQDVQLTVAITEGLIAILSLGTVKGASTAIKAGFELAFHAAAGYGLDQLMNWFIQQAVNSYAETTFSLEQGADRFGAGYVAENYVAQTGTRNVTYGRPMTLNETNAAQEVAMETLRAENQQTSFTNRYFAADNPFSLAGQVAARVPSSAQGFTGAIRTAASFMGSILTSPFKLIGSLGNTGLLFSPAHAAEVASPASSFGVEQWGWTQAEERRIENDPSFSLPTLVSIVEPRLEELNERYAPCYDSATYVMQSDKPDRCTREFLSTNDALYWRYYNSLMFAATHMTGPV